MGSGVSGNYNSTTEKSQDYAKDYSVTPDMLQYDISRGVYDGKYDINPTARKISDSIHGEFIESSTFDKSLTYVVDMNGNIIIANRNGNGFNGKATPHPTLIGGENPRVQMAGILHISGGKIVSYDNHSGHYKPNIQSMKVAEEAFGKLPSYLFKGGKKK